MACGLVPAYDRTDAVYDRADAASRAEGLAKVAAKVAHRLQPGCTGDNFPLGDPFFVSFGATPLYWLLDHGPSRSKAKSVRTVRTVHASAAAMSSTPRGFQVVSNFAGGGGHRVPRPPRHGSPRFSPRDVVRAAQQSLQQEHNRKTRMPPARGRPPPAATTSSLSAEARALLARATADLPARTDGFGAKMSSDKTQVLSIFPGGRIPKALEPTAVELEVHRVAAMVQQTEEESLSCLSGLLKTTKRSLDKAEEQMEAEKARQKELELEMQKREPGKFRPGVRNKRNKRGKKKKKRGDGGDGRDELSADGSEGDGSGSGSVSDSEESSDADGTEEGGEGEDDGEGNKASRKAKALLPVSQGYEDVFRELYPQPDDEQQEEWEYDEWGDLLPPPVKTLGPTSDRMRRIIAST